MCEAISAAQFSICILMLSTHSGVAPPSSGTACIVCIIYDWSSLILQMCEKVAEVGIT